MGRLGDGSSVQQQRVWQSGHSGWLARGWQGRMRVGYFMLRVELKYDSFELLPGLWAFQQIPCSGKGC